MLLRGRHGAGTAWVLKWETGGRSLPAWLDDIASCTRGRSTTRDRAAMLRVCLEGIATGTDYPSWQVILVDKG